MQLAVVRVYAAMAESVPHFLVRISTFFWSTTLCFLHLCGLRVTLSFTRLLMGWTNRRHWACWEAVHSHIGASHRFGKFGRPRACSHGNVSTLSNQMGKIGAWAEETKAARCQPGNTVYRLPTDPAPSSSIPGTVALCRCMGRQELDKGPRKAKDTTSSLTPTTTVTSKEVIQRRLS